MKKFLFINKSFFDIAKYFYYNKKIKKKINIKNSLKNINNSLKNINIYKNKFNFTSYTNSSSCVKIVKCCHYKNQ